MTERRELNCYDGDTIFFVDTGYAFADWLIECKTIFVYKRRRDPGHVAWAETKMYEYDCHWSTTWNRNGESQVFEPILEWWKLNEI